MTPPFNTGKVQIGRSYIRPPQPMHSIDAVRIQAAFLERRTAHPMHPIRRFIAPLWRWL